MFTSAFLKVSIRYKMFDTLTEHGIFCTISRFLLAILQKLGDKTGSITVKNMFQNLRLIIFKKNL